MVPRLPAGQNFYNAIKRRSFPTAWAACRNLGQNRVFSKMTGQPLQLATVMIKRASVVSTGETILTYYWADKDKQRWSHFDLKKGVEPFFLDDKKTKILALRLQSGGPPLPLDTELSAIDLNPAEKARAGDAARAEHRRIEALSA